MFLIVLNHTQKTIRLPNRLRLAPGENRGVDEHELYHADNTIVVEELIKMKKLTTAPLPKKETVAKVAMTVEDRLPALLTRRTILALSPEMLLVALNKHNISPLGLGVDDMQEALITKIYGSHD